jgi:hypothetical protein
MENLQIMKVHLCTLLLLSTGLAWAEKTPNPADYSVAVHVRSSRIAAECGDVTQGSSVCTSMQYLSVTIDGKKYELAGRTPTFDVLRVGDYKARILKDETKHPYEYLRTYEILFSDGATRDYYVSGESE